MDTLALWQPTTHPIAFSFEILAPYSPLARKCNFTTVILQIGNAEQSALATKLILNQHSLRHLRLEIKFFANPLRGAICSCHTLAELSLGICGKEGEVCFIIIF
jgi:hypothetical protein